MEITLVLVVIIVRMVLLQLALWGLCVMKNNFKPLYHAHLDNII
jgi:hypothetical protein